MFIRYKTHKIINKIYLITTLALLGLLPHSVFAAFSLNTTPNFYTVDTNAGVVFSIRRTDNGVSTQSAGDIASLKINGIEYQNQSRGSQINSGFDWLYKSNPGVSVSATQMNNFIKITVQAGHLTHYYMARSGYPHIYMATYFNSEPDVHGHVRYILRMKRDLLPYGPEPSDIKNTVSTVESGDIFALNNGETRSKHYSNKRLIDWRYIGASGDRAGVWLVRDNHEGGSGGPFYRSLLNQGSATDQEITYIVNYAQSQTEAFRTSILNHYTLVVTQGGYPNTDIDTSWFSQMGLKGYLGEQGRGRVAGVGINNLNSNVNYTIGFANNRAQYWTDVNPSSGYFSAEGMRPGNYEMTVYKNELAVKTQQVTVRANEISFVNSFSITDDPASDSYIWRIGQWDGSPQEFLNGDKLTTMHPSDVRMRPWNIANFIVGTTPTNSFPSYIWKDINNDHIIYFRLTPEQLRQNHRLRVGITCAFAGGRPNIKINNWTSRFQAASDQPRTRNLTTGSYRCNNTTFTYDIPSSAFNSNASDWNVLTLTVISGTTTSGYLSPSISIDAIDLLR